MTETKRRSAGVVFEPDVLVYLNELIASSQYTRSFIVNQIIREFARTKSAPEGEAPAPAAQAVIKPEPAIRF